MAKFPVPELSLKFAEMLCSILVFALIAGWESNNISYKELPTEYTARLDFAIAVGVMAFLYVIVVSIVIVVDVKFRHLFVVEIVSSAILAVLFLAAASVLAVDIKDISESNYQKTKDLSYTSLEAAVAFGFVSMVLFIGNAVLSIVTRPKS